MTAILAASHHGPMLVPPYDTYLSQAVIRLGAYCPAEFATWRPYLAEDAHIVDAGANIGAHTLAFARAAPAGKVIAVEPQRQIAYMLAGTVALNDLRHVEVRNVALGAEAGEVFIPPLDYGRAQNFGSLEVDKFSADQGEAVKRETLDSWNLARLDFLKIDVEGMEAAVLAGALDTITRCRPVMSIEADREAQVPQLLLWLRLHGYHAWWHRPLLGPLWPNVVSMNLFALPKDRDLPAPTGDVEVAFG